VSCSSRSERWSAAWVGIGGYSESSTTLAQIGTEADCSNGAPRYSTWWELLPDASHSATITVQPGDRISASVQARANQVRVRLSNLTRGTTFTKTLRVAHLDRTSAEWIVEAPSSCAADTTSSCSVMPLADFGSTRIAQARATTTGGHTGGIADGHWDTTALTLRARGGRFDGPGRLPIADAAGAAAAVGDLEPGGDAFTVTYAGS
jgi:hypothetical protein